MNNHPLEDRLRRSFSQPVPPVDSERLLRDVRRGAARRQARRTTALIAATVIAVAGAALAARALHPVADRPVTPATRPDRHGTVSGYWTIDRAHAVRVTQEHCGQQHCSRIWTKDGAAWHRGPALRWPGRQGDGIASGPVSLVQMAPDGRNGWTWGTQTWATHDGGSSWQQMPSPGGGGGPAQHLSTTVTADGRAWGLALSGRLFTAAAGADSWSPVRLPADVRSVTKVVGTDRRTAVLAQAGSAQQLIISTDDFRTSRTAPPPCAALNGEGLTADHDRFFAACAATSRDRATIWSSSDGRSWQRLAEVPHRGLIAAITGVDAHSALVTVDATKPPFPTFLVTGHHAVPVRLGPGRALPLSSQFDGRHGTLVLDVDGRQTALVRTSDGGHSWQLVESIR